MNFRMAAREDFENVMQFYYDLIDAMRNIEYCPKWEKDIYPTRQLIQASIEQNELAISLIDGIIAGAMVINQEVAEGYDQLPWRVDAAKDQVMVIHALGISIRHQGKGIGKKMVEFAINLCREKDMKVIRLDVLAANIPAQKLYMSMGFEYIGTIPLFYEDTGLTDFLLYEFAL